MKRVSYRRMIEHIAYTPSTREYGSEPLVSCIGVRMAAFLFDQPFAKVAGDVEKIWLRDNTRPGGDED